MEGEALNWETVRFEKIRNDDEKGDQDGPCPALLFDPETSLAVCQDHGNGKNEICKRTPISPEETAILQDCGFYFEDEPTESGLETEGRAAIRPEIEAGEGDKGGR